MEASEAKVLTFPEEMDQVGGSHRHCRIPVQGVGPVEARQVGVRTTAEGGG